MILDIWNLGSKGSEKEIIEIINSLKIPEVNPDKDFYIEKISISDIINGSGFQAMSNNMCRALVLSPINKKELDQFSFKESNIQIIFPEFKPRKWSNDNDNLPPKWRYKLELGHPSENFNITMYFYHDEYLTEQDLNDFIKKHLNWNCAEEHLGL